MDDRASASAPITRPDARRDQGLEQDVDLFVRNGGFEDPVAGQSGRPCPPVARVPHLRKLPHISMIKGVTPAWGRRKRAVQAALRNGTVTLRR